MAFQSGPEEPLCNQQKGWEEYKKNMPGWQVPDNRTISNLVQTAANKNWIQTDSNIDRNARTQVDFFSKQVLVPFVNVKIKSCGKNEPTSFGGHPFKVTALSPRIYTCNFTFSTSAETHTATRCPLCHIKPTWNEFHYQSQKSHLKKVFLSLGS